MSDNTGVKLPPQHNTVGTPCNIVEGCGKTAFYVVGSKYACADHRDKAYRLAARRGKKQTNFEPEPEVEINFEPEVEEVPEVVVTGIRFSRMVDAED